MKGHSLHKFFAVFFLCLFGISVSSQSLQSRPLTFYPADKSFFYTSFCKKYECVFGSKEKKDDRWTLENFGFLNPIYTGFLDIDTIRTKKVGEKNWWYAGIDLKVNPKYHYDKFYVDPSKNYLNPDVQNFMSELLFFAVGKKYSKDQLLKCMSANFKIKPRYYLDEFLKFPASAPITRVSSGQGVPLYLKILCGFENNIFSIELSP
jgi:hypothetical protein